MYEELDFVKNIKKGLNKLPTSQKCFIIYYFQLFNLNINGAQKDDDEAKDRLWTVCGIL